MVLKTTGFIHRREILRQRSATESRRDDILLTVDFNLRTKDALRSLQSPAGTILYLSIVPSLRDLVQTWSLCFRRLKPTVNKVLSLRDISPLIMYITKKLWTIFLQK